MLLLLIFLHPMLVRVALRLLNMKVKSKKIIIALLGLVILSFAVVYLVGLNKRKITSTLTPEQYSQEKLK